MSFFGKPTQSKSSISDYDRNDSLSFTELVKETVVNNCSFSNARAVGIFAAGVLFIYFVSQRFGVDDEAELSRKIKSLN